MDVTGGIQRNRLEQSSISTESHVSCENGMKPDGKFRPSCGNRKVMGGRWRNKMEYLWIFMESHSTCENEMKQDGRIWNHKVYGGYVTRWFCVGTKLSPNTVKIKQAS